MKAKKEEFAKNVWLTKREYELLVEKLGSKVAANKKIENHSKEKELDSERDFKQKKWKKPLKSDYRALVSQGMKAVEPIRNKEKLVEMKNILKRYNYRDYFLMHMGVNTGYRISDLLEFKVKDVLGKTHVTVKEKKTGKKRRLKLHTGLQPDIEEYVKVMGLGEEDYLYPSQKTDAPISRVQAYRVLNKAAKEVGLEEIGTHTLRKTFGYHHYQVHKDVAQLQELFGHSAPSITMRYIGINQDMLDKSIDELELL